MARPTIWHVPYERNQFFTGRDDNLTHLHQLLQIDDAGVTPHLGVSGLGGVGKTQIALEYAYRYQVEYEMVFWARADTSTNLINDLVELAEVLKLPERHEQDHMARVCAVLNHSGWLLIYDNIDDVSIVEPFLPTGPGHLLFTTRAQALAGFAQPLHLDKMDPDTGALLLLRKANIQIFAVDQMGYNSTEFTRFYISLFHRILLR